MKFLIFICIMISLNSRAIEYIFSPEEEVRILSLLYNGEEKVDQIIKIYHKYKNRENFDPKNTHIPEFADQVDASISFYQNLLENNQHSPAYDDSRKKFYIVVQEIQNLKKQKLLSYQNWHRFHHTMLVIINGLEAGTSYEIDSKQNGLHTHSDWTNSKGASFPLIHSSPIGLIPLLKAVLNLIYPLQIVQTKENDVDGIRISRLAFYEHDDLHRFFSATKGQKLLISKDTMLKIIDKIKLLPLYKQLSTCIFLFVQLHESSFPIDINWKKGRDKTSWISYHRFLDTTDLALLLPLPIQVELINRGNFGSKKYKVNNEQKEVLSDYLSEGYDLFYELLEEVAPEYQEGFIQRIWRQGCSLLGLQ